MLFEDLSFTVVPGNILQITGSNGCGKTSLIRILCGLLPATAGSVTWHDRGIDECRDELTFIGHQTGVKLNLSPRENLKVDMALANAADTGAIDKALDQVGLQNHKEVLAKNLSAGQQRRIALARLLLLNKPLWILDEPLTALDSDGANLVKSLIKRHIVKRGMVIFSSHQSIASEHMPIKELRFDQ